MNKKIKELEREIEKGKLGKVDYEWDGNKVVRDNIIFKRREFFGIIDRIIKELSLEIEKVIDEWAKKGGYAMDYIDVQNLKQKLLGGKMINKEKYPEKTIEKLDELFPKGDKRRGDAMVILALAFIEGKEMKK